MDSQGEKGQVREDLSMQACIMWTGVKAILLSFAKFLVSRNLNKILEFE